MRRSKQAAAVPEPPTVSPSNVSPAVAPPRPPVQTNRPEAAPMSAELTHDDLERGRTIAMIAALGRVQLTLDLIERRLGRLEDAVVEIHETLESERQAGLLPAGLAYVDAPVGETDEATAGEADEATEEVTDEPSVGSGGADIEVSEIDSSRGGTATSSD